MSQSKEESETDETQLLISKLVRLSKITNDKYPSGTDYRYFCSYSSFNEESNKLSNNVLNLLSKLCNFVNSNNKNDINLLSENNEYLRWQKISDSADHCIEKVDLCLDQIKELKNNQSLHNKNKNNKNNNNSSSSSSSSKKKQNRLFSGEINDNNSLELLYPQRSFLDIIDNKRNTPFKPNLINGKTNGIKPYNLELIEDDNNNKYYGHPYLYEINNIQYKEYQLIHRKEEESIDINDTMIYWIDSECALSEMCEILSCCNEIGVDLEHHSKYTFSGITCLIQISTRNKDYIIDALALRKYIHIYLNPIFTDSNIIKIFHGAMGDIKWLQRDFSIYVVNLFDTFEAAKLLHLKQKSLKYLLKKYCDIDTNKYLRMTDWRIRPLRPELIDYARKDTHYLLYIFDHLTNLLIERSTKTNNLLIECYKNSEKICLIRYEKPYFDINGWQYLCQRKAWYFINNKSLNALSKLYEWRDRIGRDLDQSIDVILSNKLLKQIVTDLPQNDKQLLNSKKYNLSIIAKKYYKDILNIINEAININDKNSIHQIFELNMNNNNNSKTNKKKENIMDLNTICCSNDGCFHGDNHNDDDHVDIMDIDKDEVCKLDMISTEYNDDNKNASKVSFFPINNVKFDEQDNNAQNIANEIFNEISNEPVLKLIEQTINYQQENKNKNKKKNKKQNKNNNINKKQKEDKQSKQRKLKKNNIDRVANASNRDKIFGSRYLDRNSKKDVFKLPRDNKKNKKRKIKDIDIDGPILENIQPQKKKRKISKYKQIQEKLKQDREQKRMNKITAVNDEWPINKINDNINQQIIKKEKKSNKKNKNKDKNNNNNNNNNKGEQEEDIEMTESDILDAAPVPVLDTKFENVYDPFKSNLPS